MELGLSYRSFEGFRNVKLEDLVTGFRDDTNGGSGWYVADGFSTVFGRDADGVTIGVEVIELFFR